MSTALSAAVAPAQELTAADRGKVDAAVQQVIAKTSVPSVSVGVARGGHVAYTQGYGMRAL